MDVRDRVPSDAPRTLVPPARRRAGSARDRTRRFAPGDALLVVLAGTVVLRVAVPKVWMVPSVQAWATVFDAVCIQATPYVVLGVALSAVVGLLPTSVIARLPRRLVLALPLAALAGCALPGCECGSVPLATSLLRRGVPAGPAFTMMLSAPSANPVVVAATAAAFPGRPGLVAARWAASLAASLCVGAFWHARPGPVRCRPRPDHEHGSSWASGLDDAARDLAQSLGLLAVGAASAACVQVLVPRSVLVAAAGAGPASTLALALLAVVMAVCSEADAFIAASFTQFSASAQLAFMVVGPMVDVKLAAMQIGAFGGRAAARIEVVAFVAAVGCAAVAAVVLGVTMKTA